MFTPVSLRQKNPALKAAFSLFYSLCLALLLFPILGCPLEDNDDDLGFELNPALIGTWTFHSDLYGDDWYTITDTKLTYTNDAGVIYGGTIRAVSTFSDEAGVIIIEYDEDKKPAYYPDDHWGDPEYELPLKGNFLGTYYKELKPGVSVRMGQAYIAGGPEEKTLDDAIKAFTEGNEGTYIGDNHGTYSK